MITEVYFVVRYNLYTRVGSRCGGLYERGQKVCIEVYQYVSEGHLEKGTLAT